MTDCSQRLLARRPHIMRMLNIDKDGKTSETFYPMCPYCDEHFWQLGCWSIGICRSNHFCPRCGQNILWDSLTNEEVFKMQHDALERKIHISKHKIAAFRKRITNREVKCNVDIVL